jgi:ABC-2 type transport system permease protein
MSSPTTTTPTMTWRRSSFITWRIILLSVRVQLQYRTELAMAILFGVIWQASVLAFMSVLITRFPGLGGWTPGMVLMMASMRLMAHSGYVGVFSNLGQMQQLIDESRVDGFLLRPLPVFRQVLLSSIRMNALGDLLVSVTLLVAAVNYADLHWTVWKVIYFAAAMVSGTLIESAIQAALSGISLRLPGAANWGWWFDNLMSNFGNYPLSILPIVVRFAFTFVLPVAFLAYLPVAVLFDRADQVGLPVWLVQWSPLLGPVMFFGAKRFWDWSLKHYRGIGG